MNNKTIQIALISLFLICSLVPFVGMLLFGPSTEFGNEVLSQPAQLRTAEGSFNGNVLNDLSDNFSDRFFFRKELITAWARINSSLFRSSVEDQVVLGSDGWLYYAPTLDDYMGRSVSDAELEKAAMNLALMQSECEKLGARFVFTIAPNKNSLYRENMPSLIPAAHGQGNAERILPYLEKYGVNYADLFSAFSENENTLYYRTDSHWTNRGAALAADRILSSLGIDSSYYNSSFIPAEPHRGDLFDMLYPADSYCEAAESCAAGFRFKTSGNPKGGEALKIHTSGGGTGGILLCWRDSFGNSLYPYLADSFSEAHFLRSNQYDLNAILDYNADTVVFELVERNLRTLADMKLVIPEAEP